MSALTDQKVLGIVRAGSPEEAVTLARRLLGAGLRCVEVAFTTPQAAQALREVVAGAPPGAVVGAGTVLSEVDAAAAVAAGARFLVAPDLDEGVVRAAHHLAVPVLPGAGTVTEMRRALKLGADAVKLFPAAHLGPGWLRDVRAALPTLPVVPTGGVTPAALRSGSGRGDRLRHGFLADVGRRRGGGRPRGPGAGRSRDPLNPSRRSRKVGTCVSSYFP